MPTRRCLSRLAVFTFIVGLLFALSPAAAQTDTPTPTPTGTRQVNRRLLTDRVRGLQLQAKTDESPIACWTPSFDVTAFYVAGIIPNGGTTDIVHQVGETLMNAKNTGFPTICTTNTSGLGGAVATSPGGRTIPAYTWTYDSEDFERAISHYEAFQGIFHAASLPLEAYRQPGAWTLSVRSPTPYTITIIVPEIDDPFGIIDTDNGGVFVGGMRASERVVAFMINDAGDFIDATEFVTDANGYGIGQFTPYRLGNAVWVIGERTTGFTYPFQSTAFDNFDDDFTPDIAALDDNQLEPDEMFEYVRDFYFLGNSGALTVGSCGTDFAARLRVGGTGRRLDPDVNVNIRPSASTARDRIGLIDTTTPFTVLDGPECAGGYTWWNIEWEGIDGWIAEAANGVYLVEPATGRTSASATSTPAPISNYFCYGAQEFTAGYWDEFFIGMNGGDVITIKMTRTDTSLDPYLSLLDPNGAILIDNDDVNGTLDSEIRLHVVPVTGTYEIEARSYAGASGGSYNLLIIVGDNADAMFDQVC